MRCSLDEPLGHPGDWRIFHRIFAYFYGIFACLLDVHPDRFTVSLHLQRYAKIHSKIRVDTNRGKYGDFKMLHSSKTDSTTAHNICLGYPKRPRSLSNSIVDRSYAIRKFYFFSVRTASAPREAWRHTGRHRSLLQSNQCLWESLQK